MYEFIVPDMICSRCADNIKQVLSAIDAGAAIDARVRDKRVRVATKAGRQKIEEAVAAAGYTVRELRVAMAEEACC